MSGICGILNLDGAPVDHAVFDRMMAAIAHRGPDGIHRVVDGNVALGHAMLCTTPESLHESQPLWDESRLYCLVLDGRIDNRAELHSDLAGKGSILRDNTDAELVLKSYIAWGENSPRHLLGDFSYVVYDKLRRQLFCARDRLGQKPFYYATKGTLFVWGTELQQLLKHPAVQRKPNLGMLAEHLAFRITSIEETLYEGTFRLPPAHSMVVKSAGPRRERYWDPDLKRQIRYSTDSDYQAHCRELIDEAVRCRMRSHLPVSANLSGGIDSSTVVGISAALLRGGRAHTPYLEAVSQHYPGLNCDETRFIEAAIRHTHVPARRVLTAWDPSAFVNTAVRYQDIPDFPNGTSSDCMQAAIAASGCRVSLTGMGGDEWFNPAAPVRAAARLRRLLSASRRLLRGEIVGRGYPGWITARFARDVRLGERLSPPGPRAFLNATQGVQFAALRYGVFCREMRERTAARFGIEERAPLEDTRLVEFALAMPEAQHRGSKSLLRRSCADVLPDVIRMRLDKSDFSELYVRSLLAPAAARFFKHPASTELGFCRASVVRRMYDDFCSAKVSGGEYPPHIVPLWSICGAECWLSACVLKMTGGGIPGNCQDIALVGQSRRMLCQNS